MHLCVWPYVLFVQPGFFSWCNVDQLPPFKDLLLHIWPPSSPLLSIQLDTNCVYCQSVMTFHVYSYRNVSCIQIYKTVFSHLVCYCNAHKILADTKMGQRKRERFWNSEEPYNLGGTVWNKTKFHNDTFIKVRSGRLEQIQQSKMGK